MKHSFKLVLAAIAVTSLSGAARADLTFQGAVGLPQYPTAQLPEQKGARVQLNYQDLGDGSNLYGVSGSLRVGKSPLEVSGSVNRLHVDGSTPVDEGNVQTLAIDSNDGTGFSVGAKYLFSRETDPANVRLAAGLGYTRYDNGDTTANDTYGYVVASKYLTKAIEGRTSLIGHLGVRYDNFDADGADSSDKFSVYAGAEVPLTRKGDLQVVGEIGTKIADGSKSPYSVGLRYRAANQPFGATVGVSRFGGFDNDAKLFAQIGYTFNTK